MIVKIHLSKTESLRRGSRQARAYLSSEALAALGLTDGKLIHLVCGRRGVKVRLFSGRAADKESRLVLPADLGHYLLLRAGSRCHLSHSASGTLELGPTVAMLSSRRVLYGYFGRVVVRALRQGQIACVAMVEDINPKADAIVGYQPVRSSHGGLSWQKRRLPFPLLIYNRIPNRTSERRSQGTLSRLQAASDVHLANPGFFNKWQVYRLLSHTDMASAHMPPTIRWHSRKQAYDFLRKHRRVYLKPIGGSKGIGIICLHKRDRRYAVTLLSHHQQRAFILTGWDQTWRRVRSITGDRHYIMQAAVPLARMHQRPFDVRISVQKDGDGNWEAVGLGAKVANRHGIATHVINGGQLVPVRTALRHAFGSRAETVLEDLLQTVLVCSQELEASLGKPLIELGWDMAIDPSGYSWVLECNAKPGRVIFRLRDMRNADRRAVAGLVDYCRTAAGFGGD